MRIQIDWKILTAAIVCLMSVSQGMIKDPFRRCSATAQVDSIQDWFWEADSLETTPPPYRGLFNVIAYYPGTCIVAKDSYEGYWMTGPDIGTYTVRPGTKTVDYVNTFAAGTPQTTGTMYYGAAVGSVDSGETTEPMVDQDGEPVVDAAGKQVMKTTFTRLLPKTGYELATVMEREGTGPWTLVQQDSTVPNGKGKIVYSKGRENSVTTCVADEKTYACTPVATDSAEYDLWKQVWYLTGDRVDSLRWFNPAGLHASTNIWFWSIRSGIRIVKKAPASSPRMAKPGTAFDVAGRKVPAWNRAQPRFINAGAWKD
jgi:hypothetical protein